MSSARLWLALAGVILGFAAMLIWFGEGGTRGTPIRVAFAGPVSGVSDSLEIAFRANRVEFSMQMSRADAESFRSTLHAVLMVTNQVDRICVLGV